MLNSVLHITSLLNSIVRTSELTTDSDAQAPCVLHAIQDIINYIGLCTAALASNWLLLNVAKIFFWRGANQIVHVDWSKILTPKYH